MDFSSLKTKKAIFYHKYCVEKKSIYENNEQHLFGKMFKN